VLEEKNHFAKRIYIQTEYVFTHLQY
jgi:hypothetical protein